MRRLALHVLVVAALAGLAACARVAGDDEVPIIVRNSSMDIESQGGKFNDVGTDFEHVSTDATHTHKNSFWVKVSTNGTVTGCTEKSQDNKVEIVYSNNFVASFKITGSKTRIGPKASFDRVGESTLKYSPDGFIKAVKVGNTEVCTFTSKNQLRDVAICTDAATRRCQ